MAKNRINPESERPTPLQPAAQPVDTYYRPMEPVVAPPPHPDNSLTQIGKALSQFSNQVGYSLAVSQNVSKAKDKADMDAGLALFNVRRTSLAEAQKSDPNFFNPARIQGYEAGYAQNVARQLGDTYMLDLYKNPGQDIETLSAKYIKEAQATLGPNPHVYSLTHQDEVIKSQVSRMRLYHEEFQKKNIIENQHAQFGTLISQQIEDNLALVQSGQMTKPEFFALINGTIRDSGTLMGITHDDVNKLVTQGITNYIERETQDGRIPVMSGLDLANGVQTGTGNLGGNPKYRDIIQASERQAISINHAQQEWDWKQTERGRKQEQDKIYEKIFNITSKNPGANVDTLINQYNKLGGDSFKLKNTLRDLQSDSVTPISDGAYYSTMKGQAYKGTIKPIDIIQDDNLTKDEKVELVDLINRNGTSKNKSYYNTMQSGYHEQLTNRIRPAYAFSDTWKSKASEMKLEFDERFQDIKDQADAENWPRYKVNQETRKMYNEILKEHGYSTSNSKESDSKATSKPVSKSNSSQGINTPKQQNNPTPAKPGKPKTNFDNIYKKNKVDTKNPEQLNALLKRALEIKKRRLNGR